MRLRQLNVRMSAEEGERVDEIARHYGLQPADVVRLLIKREADRLAALGSRGRL